MVFSKKSEEQSKLIILIVLILVFIATSIYSVGSLQLQAKFKIGREKAVVAVLDVTLSDKVDSMILDEYRGPVVAFDFTARRGRVRINSVTLTRENIGGEVLDGMFSLVNISSDARSFVNDRVTFNNLNQIISAGNTKTIIVEADLADNDVSDPYSFVVSIDSKDDILAQNVDFPRLGVTINDGDNNLLDSFEGPNVDRSVVITVKDIEKPSEILDAYSYYDQLHTVRETLYNLEAVFHYYSEHPIEGFPDMGVLNIDSSRSISGADLVKQILDDGYNPEDLIDNVDAFINEKLDGYFFPFKSHRIFITNVANGLWVEYNGIYPWSLKDYSVKEIENLFIENELIYFDDYGSNRGNTGHLPEIEHDKLSNYYVISSGVIGDTSRIIVEEGLYKQFKLGRSIVSDANNQEEAVLALVGWMEKNFLHAYFDYGWEVYPEREDRDPNSDGGGWDDYYPQNLEQIYEQRIIGCHLPTFMGEAFLHSMNIPVKRLRIHGHGVLYLPTFNRFIHGDNIADFAFVPPEGLLLTEDEILRILEIADDPDNSRAGYDVIIKEKYEDYSDYFVTNTSLLRDENLLYLLGHYIHFSSVDPDLFAAAQEQVLPEFDLQYNSDTREVYSTNRNPILSLEELSEL